MDTADLKAALETVVRASLEGYTPRHYKKPKVIHDAVHGSNVFDPIEVAVLDLPLVQRLRRIRQLGMVLQVYPAGAHSRFDHSLGVTTMVGRVIDSLNSRNSDPPFSPQQKLELRVSALLHDIGHMPFSHITEDILRQQVDFKAVRNDLGIVKTAKEHEILGSLMLQTAAFKELFIEPLKNAYPAAATLRFDRIGGYIVGMAAKNEDYMARLISGVLDADKMDYILRDCHMTGLKMSVDIDRILQTVMVVEHQGLRTLAIDLNGVSTVEQLLFDKLLLNMAVYHHQKVRATECLIKGLYELLIERGIDTGPYNIKANPVDLVRMTDDDILVLENSKDADVRRLTRRLTRRELLMRSVVISDKLHDRDETAKLKEGLGYSDFLGLGQAPARQRQLREALAGLLKLDVHEVWIDAPQPPHMGEAGNFVVRDPQGPTMLLTDVFPVGYWLNSYNATKLRGYVFLPPEAATAENAQRVSGFLRDELGLALTPGARAV